MRAAVLGRSRALALAAGLAAALFVVGALTGVVRETAASWSGTEQGTSSFMAQAPGTPQLSCSSTATTPAVISWTTPTTTLQIAYSEYRWELRNSLNTLVDSGTVASAAGPPYSLNSATFNGGTLSLGAPYTLTVTAFSGAWNGTAASTGLTVTSIVGLGLRFACR